MAPTGLFLQDSGAAINISSILSTFQYLSPYLGAAGAGLVFSSGSSPLPPTASVAYQVNLAVSKSTIRECYLTGNQDCEAGIPIVFYGQTFQGQSLQKTTEHIQNALQAGLPSLLSAWATVPADHGTRKWYKNKPPCNQPAKGRYVEAAKSQGIIIRKENVTCDEYPFYGSEQGGRKSYDGGFVSLRLVPEPEAGLQGRLMDDDHLREAGVVKGDVFKKWYGVVSIPELPSSFWRNRNINS